MIQPEYQHPLSATLAALIRLLQVHHAQMQAPGGRPIMPPEAAYPPYHLNTGTPTHFLPGSMPVSTYGTASPMPGSMPLTAGYPVGGGGGMPHPQPPGVFQGGPKPPRFGAGGSPQPPGTFQGGTH